jgi:hypothetical protein
VDLLQRGDDEQLQAEPAEQLQREPGRLVGARPNASSMTANRNVRDFAAPHSSLNW